ncbi:MAG TPA: DUF1501 domain-containing protein [Candidatus Hydrogenedentes bacterium]|nr:DUF1501 domain-containing protein [Candidatus Hydrogenedentota bacterium]
MNQLTRRDFFKSAAVYSALGTVAPQFLTQTVEATTQAIAGFNNDRVLVVVQLAGGNDGLNMLVPYSNDAYYNARPGLALKKERLITINDDLAFNQKFSGMKNVYDNGQLAIIQGIGYPNPDRSHFRSMEIWHTASDSDEYESTGWIGRYFDHECSGSARPQVGVSITKEHLQAFSSKKGYGVSFEDPKSFGWKEGKGHDSSNSFAELNAATSNSDSNIDFLRHVTSNAIMSSKEVHKASEMAGQEMNRRGRTPLSRTLSNVAALIKNELSTRIYYVNAGGFDTHANQTGQHDNLLNQVSTGLEGFQNQLRKDGTADRVTTMIFSEFGRRVNENKSGGTDHGTAAPMFLMGENVNAGLHGRTPSLTDLDQGDLKFTTDFRSAYADVLENWFAVDPVRILGKKFDPLKIIG